MAVGSTSGATTVSADQTGFGGLTSAHFMQLLITEMQNQDPLEPMGNEQILNQLSTMRTMQSNVELSETLGGFTNTMQLSAGAGYIGAKVTGYDLDNEQVVGVVDRAFFKDGRAYVGIGGKSVPVSQISDVELA